MQTIKKRARVLVPDSGTLIGVVDQDGILEEGEVFVQIRKDQRDFQATDGEYV